VSPPGASAVAPRSGGAWLAALGFVIEELTGDRVSGHIEVGAHHHTPWGVAHGGVYATVVETAASLGASEAVAPRAQYAVGTHNSTDFFRPVVSGRVDVVATPVQQGRVQQLWAVNLTDHATGKLVAQGRLRLQNVPLPAEG
jgi:1,4-dihydroxy-2-naphthoyl-CoA hydrolase